jgi:hypothetical protein
LFKPTGQFLNKADAFRFFFSLQERKKKKLAKRQKFHEYSLSLSFSPVPLSHSEYLFLNRVSPIYAPPSTTILPPSPTPSILSPSSHIAALKIENGIHLLA